MPDGIDRPNPFRTGRTLVIAHGGGDGEFPEDTLYAYEHSVPLGSEVIDLDVQSTADGVIVALHDDTVDRTTNGKGAVKSMTFASLEKLDAGWGFEKNGAHPFRGKGLTVPRVEDALARYPTMLATLDLKDLSVDVVDPLCSMIRRLNRVDTIYVGVDTSEQVHEFRRACPEVRTSGTDEERAAARAARDRGDLTYRSAQTVGQPSYLAADGTPRVTAASIAASHARNVAMMPWVVDDPAAMRTLVAACVDGIYTRRPEVLRAIVDKETPAACALAAPAAG